jgi:hypothetical protein
MENINKENEIQIELSDEIAQGIPIIIAIILSYKCVLYDLISKTQS